MDVVILFTIASVLAVMLFIFAVMKHRYETAKNTNQEEKKSVTDVQQRRAAMNRNIRARMRVGASSPRQNTVSSKKEEDNNDDNASDEQPEKDAPTEKMGAKKRAKLEAKAAQKAAREIQEQEREEKKRKQEQEEEERKKQEQDQKDEEARKEEEERKIREEKERKEHEEYLKMKEMFSVEEEGFDEEESEEADNLLRAFIDYIKTTKVVILEDLAVHFKLKTQNVIERIQTLQEEGTLTGVIDDRGKFIYISREELEAVAKFVRQRGRVSITDLAESSNELINLSATIKQPVLTES